MPHHLPTSSSTLPPPPAARHYHSDLSIWLSVDPMADKYPGVSPYVYCGNNPVRLVDPNGEFPIPKHWKFVRDAFAKRINRITLCKIQYGNGVRADILHAGRSSTHMDNMKGTAEISSAYQKAISDYHSNMGKGNYADAGENLHTIADFYSHSNYIDMYLGYAEENGKSLNPKEIKTFSEMMEDKNFMNYVEKNGGLKTGEFTLKDYLKEKFGLQEPSPDSHTNVNLDKRTSKKGKEPYGNSTKYEAAKEAASKEINKIVNE